MALSPVSKVNGKLQLPNPDRMMKETDTSGMKIWAPYSKIQPRFTEVLVEGGGNT